MIEKNMIKWIQEILIHYVIDIRTEINQDDHPVMLILDNLNQHLSANVTNEFKKIEPIYTIPLPPHSSHLTQICDTCAFGAVKTRYKQFPIPSYESKFTSKLCKIKNAIQQTLKQEIIIASWQKCGFEITIDDGDCVDISFSSGFQEDLRLMTVDN